jgi:hypothetical protein
MTDKGMRVIGYLLESHQAWKPDILVVPPWLTGLTSRVITRKIIRGTTIEILRATNDTR